MSRTFCVFGIIVKFKNVSRKGIYVADRATFDEIQKLYERSDTVRVDLSSTFHLYNEADVRMSVQNMMREVMAETYPAQEIPERLDPLDYKIAAHKRQEERELQRKKAAAAAFQEREARRKHRDARKPHVSS